jgi:phosphoserine phosphatase
MNDRRDFAIVCFDCDSTLSRIEGIDELARRSGVGKQVEDLTNTAMNGGAALESVYARRLSLIKPDKSAINWVAQRYIDELVDGAVEVVNVLQASGKHVHVISGGIRQAILPMLEKLGLTVEHLHAVDIYFNEDGSYKGFNTDSPLARTGGKADVCRMLSKGQDALLMVGDGQTDLEAKQAGAYFVGFGGVVAREAVRLHADEYIEENSLLPILQFFSEKAES